MRVLVLVSFAIALLLGSIGASGCSFAPDGSGAKSLSPGATFTTGSGLGLTVPAGGSAEIEPPESALAQAVRVDPAGQPWVATFVSYKPGMGTLDLTRLHVLAAIDASRVVVAEPATGSPDVVVYTRLAGAAAGTVVIGVPHDSRPGLSGLALARDVWRKLHVSGASLP